MSEHEPFGELEKEIRKLPKHQLTEKSYQKIHQHVTAYADGYQERKQKIGRIVKLAGIMATMSAMLLFLLITLSFMDNGKQSANEPAIREYEEAREQLEERPNEQLAANEEKEAVEKEQLQERQEAAMKQEGAPSFIPSEEEFQIDLHQMTHQKVKAYPKWGSLQITPSRINNMLEILKEADYNNHDFYVSVLTKWKNGDFTNAVEVHNFLFEAQGGTTGVATRLLTEQEEQKYIEEQFHYMDSPR